MTLTENKVKNSNIIKNTICILAFVRFFYPVRIILRNQMFDLVYSLVFLSIIFWYVIKYYRVLEFKNIKSYILSKRYFIFLFIYLLIFLMKVIYYGDFTFEFYSASSELKNYFNLIIALVIGEFVSSYDKNDTVKVNRIIVFAINITILWSLIYLISFDSLSIRRGNAVQYGVADFSLVYTSVFLSLYTLDYVYLKGRKSDNKKNKIVFLLLTLFYLLFIFKSGYMIALLLTIYASFLYFLVEWRNVSFSRLLKLHIIVFVIFVFLRKPIGIILINFSEFFEHNWVMQKKMLAMGNVLSGYGTEFDTIFDRFNLIFISLKSFIQNPFFGISFNNYTPGTIGNHTQWFDQLARMGMLSMLYFLFLFSYYKYYIKNSDELRKIVFFIYIVLGFLNPNLMSPLTFLLFGILFPSFKYLEDHKPTKQSKVSIIIPAYNAEETIEFAVNSILSQEYRNIEIVIVNDGSLDKTEEKVKRIQQNNSSHEICLINKSNGGVSSARNVGLNNCSGDYVCFLDADDYYHPKFIEETLNTNYDVCFCQYSRVRDNKVLPAYSSVNVAGDFNKMSILELYLKGDFMIHTSNWIIKRSLIDSNSIQFNDLMNWGEDILFFSTVLLYSDKVKSVNKFLTYYIDDYDENRLSRPKLDRIEKEKMLSHNLSMCLLSSDLAYSDTKKIIDVIYEFRLPATTFYTYKYSSNDMSKNLLVKLNLDSSYVNGLRSLKLKIYLQKEKLKLHFLRVKNNEA